MDAKAAAGEKAETLFSQTMETVSRWQGKRRGERLGLDQIKAHLIGQARGRWLLKKHQELEEEVAAAAKGNADEKGSGGEKGIDEEIVDTKVQGIRSWGQ